MAANKHVKRIAALKPVADAMDKLSNSDVGVNIELLHISGPMTVSLLVDCAVHSSIKRSRSTFHRRRAIESGQFFIDEWTRDDLLCRIGFSEMPELHLKVTPVFGENKYSYTLIHDFLEARIRDEIKRLLVLPSMDDQLLAFMRDWVVESM
jgi:ribosomal protein S26